MANTIVKLSGESGQDNMISTAQPARREQCKRALRAGKKRIGWKYE